MVICRKYFTAIMILFVLSQSAGLQAQEVIKKTFYTGNYKPASESKAKIVELILRDADSSLIYETRKAGSNKLIRREIYKDSIPVGKWYDGGSEKDYDFEMVYIDDPCTEAVSYDPVADKTTGVSAEDSFTPAAIIDLNRFFVREIRYPTPAKEQNIQGRVLLHYTINKNGQVEQVSVYKGSHPILAKEALRVLRKSPPWQPALLNGEPVSSCVILPVTFRLE